MANVKPKNASSGLAKFFWQRTAVCGSAWQRKSASWFDLRRNFQKLVVRIAT
jgi:hypothetical protein